MATTKSDQRLILQISGVDKPGVTAQLTRILAEEKASLINIGQSVLNGYLILSAIVDIPDSSPALRKVLFTLARMDMRCELHPVREHMEDHAKNRAHCATLLGALENGQAVADFADFLASKNSNILDIKTLTHEGLRGMEFIFNANLEHPEKEVKLREELFSIASRHGIDFALQRENIFRKHRRLVCLDVDSTFVPIEAIDELANLCGKKEEVSQITEQAMQGKLDFKDSFKKRLATLSGLEVEKARTHLSKFQPNEDVLKLIKILKQLGYKIGLVSGGFEFFVQDLKERFNLDFAFANRAEQKEGRFTGKSEGLIVDAERKSQVLSDVAEVFNCSLDQCVAIGDGANDIPMLNTAGLGIAYHAKPTLQEVAQFRINSGTLESMLYLLGYKHAELRDLIALAS